MYTVSIVWKSFKYKIILQEFNAKAAHNDGSRWAFENLPWKSAYIESERYAEVCCKAKDAGLIDSGVQTSKFRSSAPSVVRKSSSRSLRLTSKVCVSFVTACFEEFSRSVYPESKEKKLRSVIIMAKWLELVAYKTQSKFGKFGLVVSPLFSFWSISEPLPKTSAAGWSV